MDDMAQVPPNREMLRLRDMLDAAGIEYDKLDRDANHYTYWDVGGVRYKYTSYGDSRCGCLSICCANFLTPEQAIAATVGNGTDLSKRLREVTGLRSFAELFGFSWTDESDWSWHDVACAMADAIDATVGVGACKRIYHPNRITKTCTCSNCGYGASDKRWAYCPKCGHKYLHGEVEEWWESAGRKVAE